MTKTIEEKANEKYNNPVEPYCFETDNEEQWYGCGLRDGYIEGAIDQCKIDIEKAVNFIMRNKTLDRWVNVDAIADQLRKAMEDEQ